MAYRWDRNEVQRVLETARGGEDFIRESGAMNGPRLAGQAHGTDKAVYFMTSKPMPYRKREFAVWGIEFFPNNTYRGNETALVQCARFGVSKG